MSDKEQNVDVEPLSDEDLESAAGGARDWCSWDDCSNSSEDADEAPGEVGAIG